MDFDMDNITWLRMWVLTMEGEGRQMLQVLQGMVGDKVKGEAVPFTFPGPRNTGEVLSAALVYLESLEHHLLQLLEENKLLVKYHI